MGTTIPEAKKIEITHNYEPPYFLTIGSQQYPLYDKRM